MPEPIKQASVFIPVESVNDEGCAVGKVLVGHEDFGVSSPSGHGTHYS